jgi:hypothetical protein
MPIRSATISVAALAVGLSLVFTSSAGALTAKECSAKYQAAKTAGTLAGQTWNEFRKTQCGASAAPASAPTTAAPPPAAAPAPAPTTAAPPPAAAPAAPKAAGNTVFPTAVSPKYSNESAGKARMHTCLDQYKANQAANANGGLKWTQKGGGYYSECSKRLKG